MATILGYENPKKAIRDHVDDEDKTMGEPEVTPSITDTLGRVQYPTFINESGVYSLILRSHMPKARAFKHWVTSEVLPSLRKTRGYSLQSIAERLKILDEKLENSGLLRPFVNPRYAFERCNVRYRIATNDNGHRGIHEAAGNYFGFAVPYSASIPVTLRDYVLTQINPEPSLAVKALEKFIVGIETHQIIRNDMGNWISLNGFGGNNVEWPKILHEFGGVCAYCGERTMLLPEHIVPQSVLAKESPGAVDLIGNIVCACGNCNHSKGKHDMEEWYRRQSFFSTERLRKIHRHQVMYEIH